VSVCERESESERKGEGERERQLNDPRERGGGRGGGESGVELEWLIRELWGYNPVCKVTPVILHGVVSQEGLRVGR
jgi:hypothetical protein